MGGHFKNCYCQGGSTIFICNYYYYFFLGGGKVCGVLKYTTIFSNPPPPPSPLLGRNKRKVPYFHVPLGVCKTRNRLGTPWEQPQYTLTTPWNTPLTDRIPGTPLITKFRQKNTKPKTGKRRLSQIRLPVRLACNSRCLTTYEDF